MHPAIIKFDGKEVELGGDVVTLGRTPDNTIAFPADSNVSRYHAEIEDRGGDYWLIELGSSNGTTVNGERVTGERRLESGDRIVFGGSSEAVFEIAGQNEAAAITPVAVPTGAASAESRFIEKEEALIRDETAIASKPNSLLLIAGGICVLAVIFVSAAGVIYWASGSKCEAKALITNPEPGDTIIEPVDIEVEAENTGCVTQAVFMLDGEKIAVVKDEPYTATLDPSRYPDFADGFEHNLQIILVDENGEQIVQPGQILIALETRKIEKAAPTPEIVATDANRETKPAGKTATLVDIAQMAQRLAKQFPGNYNVSNKQFLQEVQKRTGEYVREGYFARASQYRDVINVAYVKEQNLDAAMGFLLAMSRSKFEPAKQGGEEGLWRMSNDFVAANAYNGACGMETLSDQTQSCAAKASALYMKAVVFGVFDGDVLYSIAAFGKSPQDAGVWKASLAANRMDVWNTIKTPREREQLIRFFAAGIVAENPQKFGLAKDRPLSELYRVTR